jgi:hypothetical protein
MQEKLLNLNSVNQQLIIAGLVGLVEDEGMSPHDVFHLLDEMKRNTFHALLQMGKEAMENHGTKV